VLPQQNQSFLTATPRPPPQHISPQGSPGPPPPPKVNGTSYIWADVGANASATAGDARMNTSQIPFNATQGGIVPVTARGVRHALQPDQQHPNITNSARSQAAPLPVVTADSLPPAWNTQKTSQAQLPGTYEAAEVPAGMQYPEAPRKPGKRKKGKKSVEDDGGGGIVPPASLGSNRAPFRGPPGGGISSTGGVIPPPSPRLGGGSGFGDGWGQGPQPGLTKSGTATPWNASHSGASMALNLPPIEIVPDSPGRGFVPNFEGWQTGRTLSQPLPSGNPWTAKVVPSPLPTASPGRSKVAGEFGSGGWGDPTTSTTSRSGIGGGMISSSGGVVPAPVASATNKKKKKREGGGGWGGS